MSEDFPANRNGAAPAGNVPLHQETEGISGHQQGAQCLVLGFAQQETENTINTLVPLTLFSTKAMTESSHLLVRHEDLADARASSSLGSAGFITLSLLL